MVGFLGLPIKVPPSASNPRSIMPTDFYYVKNWFSFQHYSNRTPPWIKLYRSILTDPDFNQLTEVQQCRLMKLWIVASDYEGRLPRPNSELTRSQRLLNSALTLSSHYLNDEKMLAPLIAKGFITQDDTRGEPKVRASIVLAQRQSKRERQISPPTPSLRKGDAREDQKSGEEEEPKRKRNSGGMVIPTEEELVAYSREKGLPESEARRCWAFYETKGWVVGRAPMKNWRIAFSRTWMDETRRREEGNGSLYTRTPTKTNEQAVEAGKADMEYIRRQQQEQALRIQRLFTKEDT